MRFSTKKIVALVSAASLVAGSSAHATVISFEFESGNQGWHPYGTAGVLGTILNDATFNTGNSLQIPAGVNGAIYTFSSPVTLGLGESLSISFDFHFIGAAGTQGPRLFFGNQVDTASVVVSDADSSYYTGIGTSAGNANYVYNGGVGAGAGIAGSGTGTTNMGGSGALSINDATSHRMVYTITNNNGYYDFLTSIDGAAQQKTLFGSSAQPASAASNFQSFNTFGIIQGSGGGNSYTIDNVTLTVPEPGSAITLFGGMGVLLGMRRRSRKV